MTLTYDGTNYGGWQIQPNRNSIQETLQDALKVLTQTDCPVTASGRTDAGVHALTQVAHLFLEKDLSPTTLNPLLPLDIRVKEIIPVPENFHARYSVKKKIYHYHIRFASDQAPLSYRYATPISYPIDLNLLQKALPLLTGTHDFSAFRGSLCGSKKPIKTLYRLEMILEEGGIRLEFEGDGFLYKMVRNIVGTLLEIASHKRPLSDLSKILEGKDRRQAGPTAPPQGLFLVQAVY